MNDRLWTFAGGTLGQFQVVGVHALRGEGLPLTSRLSVVNGETSEAGAGEYCLRGVVSNERYLTKAERLALLPVQPPLGREVARLGALIPIRKTDAWWSLPQDERRAIFEERSAHIALGQRALPNIARRLHHCRDLATHEPFDFLTWFDFAPADEQVFDDLLGALRRTEEWVYVEREVEIRVVRS